MQTIKIHCKYDKLIPIESFVTHEKNANKHPKKQIDLLARLIKFQGVRHPIIISNLSGKCVAGHGRYEALKLLDFKQIPVVYQDFDDVHQEIAFLVSDNKIQELAETDQDILNSLALEMPDDFDLDLLGIPDLELSLPDPDKEAIQDEVPEINFKTRSKLGDLYELGEHRLMCGDSTDKATVEKLMNGEKADMVFTDPPYNQSKSGGGFNDTRPGWSEHKEDELNNFDPKEIFPTFEISSAESGYFFCNKKLLNQYIDWAKTFGGWDLLVMGKNNPIPTKHKKFLSDIEYLVFIRRSGSYFDDSLEYDFYRKVRMVNVKEREFGHPTEKQVGFIEPYLKISSRNGGNVLDLFGGSGSTLIACEKTNRKCFMMELDPHYVDVIVSRWCKYTGKNKVKLNGKETIWTIDETKN